MTTGLFIVLGCISVLVLDILVVYNIVKSPFSQTAKILFIVMVVLMPVWGVVVYHLVRPALLKKNRMASGREIPAA